MLRFLSFIAGAVLGFAMAIAYLPIPGKTFYNKMSRLPEGIQNIIDDSIDIGTSFGKIFMSFTEELRFRFVESTKVAKRAMVAANNDGTSSTELKGVS
jgi:hypothetical protein